MAAVPVKAEIASDDPKPGDEAGASFGLEFQKPPKAVVGKLLAYVQVAIRSRVFAVSISARGLEQDKAVVFQELRPRVPRIRGPKPFKQRGYAAVAHSRLPGGGSYAVDRGVYPNCFVKSTIPAS